MKVKRVVGAHIAASVFLSCPTLMSYAQDSTISAMTRSPRIPEISSSNDLQVEKTFKKIGGLAWEPSASDPLGRFWISDREKRNELVSLEPTTGELKVRRIAATFKPGPLAVDVVSDNSASNETRLWILDVSRHKLFSLAGRETPPEESKIVPFRKRFPGIRIKPVTRRAEITGIATSRKPGKNEDSRIIWTCRGGGLCSTIEVVDPENKQTLAKFFPRCEPIDIAINPSGDRLWILADNGERRGAVLVERSLEVQEDRQPWEGARGKTLRLRSLPREIHPVSIVATDDSVWVITENSFDSKGLALDYPHLYQFPVDRTIQ